MKAGGLAEDLRKCCWHRLGKERVTHQVATRNDLIAFLFLIVTLVSIPQGLFADQPSTTELAFVLRNDYQIITNGSVGERDDLRFLIDSGASISVIDQRWIRKLGLKVLEEKIQVRSCGERSKIRAVILPELKLGPLCYRSAPVLVSDLSVIGSGVDVIIGLDVIRHKNLTIDYKSETLIFGAQDLEVPGLKLLSLFPLLITDALIDGEKVHLMLDTGCKDLILFEDRLCSRIKPTRVLSPSRLIQHIVGQTQVRRVLLAGLKMSDSNWKGVEAYLVEGNHPKVDGILGVSSLDIEWVYFDFQNSTVVLQ